MAVAHVQVATGLTAGATTVATAGFTPTSGNRLKVGLIVRELQTNPPTLADSATAFTYTLKEQVANADAENYLYVYEAAADSAPGSITITATMDTTTAAVIIAEEVSGAGVISATGENGPTGNARTLPIAITSAVDNSMIASFAGSGTVEGWDATAVPTNYTHRAVVASGGLSDVRTNLALATRVVGAAGVQDHTWGHGTYAFQNNRAGIAVEVTEAEEAPTGTILPQVNARLLT